MRSSCESMATPCGSNPSHFEFCQVIQQRRIGPPKKGSPKKQSFQQELDRQALFTESAVRLRRDVWGGRPGGGGKILWTITSLGKKQCFGLVAVETGNAQVVLLRKIA